MSDHGLEGLACLVTGAGSGIGRASALALAGEQARVVVADSRADAAAQVCDEIRAAGGEALAAPTTCPTPPPPRSSWRPASTPSARFTCS